MHFLLAEITDRNITRAIRDVFTKLKGRGARWAAVAGAGGWRSLAVRAYVDTTDGISREMSNLPIGDSEPMSIEDE